jgi:outer membrane protein OmpA-like peptidoglycan-associated protein
MRSRLRFALLTVALMALPAAAPAEPTGSYFEITPFGGFTFFDGDIRAHIGAPLTDDIYFGGRAGWQWKPWLGFEVAGGFTPTTFDTSTGGDVDFFHLSGNAMFTPWSGRSGSLFVFAGGGTSQLGPAVGEDLTQGNLEFGIGTKFWVSDAIGLRLELRNISWLGEDDLMDPLTNTMVLGGGLSFAIGGTPRDTDFDGVPDRKDECPDTPRGATVDERGCPKDSDGDKVWDGLDQCPDTPAGAVVDSRGCPVDSDGDGVADGIDRCADTPRGASVDASGCPRDGDGDGVFDGLDRCPDTPRGATVDSLGCPNDSDGDGVPDGVDRCAGTAPGLRVDNTGCPIEVIERETELMDTGMMRLQGVEFETGKAELKDASYAALDVVGQVLTQWPELRIEVGGHTDARGSNAYNQRLSQQRADAVLGYLKGKFPSLKPEQYTARGYGESKPIATNSSAEGMARNRRVEFVVQNRDVLRRETERRRLLEKSDTPPGTPAPAPADTTRR